MAAVLGFVCWCIAAGRVAEGALEEAPVFVVRDDDDGYRKRWVPQNTLKLQAYGDICFAASRAEDDLVLCRIVH